MSGVQMLWRFSVLLSVALSFTISLPSFALAKKKSSAAPPPKSIEEQMVGGHRLHHLSTGVETTEARYALIRGARSSIYITAYAFDDQSYAMGLLGALCAKARQGVDIRILADRHGGAGLGRLKERVRACGIRVILFNPPRWGLNKIAYSLHDKLLIVDGKSMLTGGSGIENIYATYGHDDAKWYDQDILIEGPVACWFHKRFAERWEACSNTEEDTWNSADPDSSQGARDRREYFYGLSSLKRDCQEVSAGDARVLGVYNDPFDSKKRPIFDSYRLVFATAEKEILLYAPYFVPTKEFVDLLLDARRRGVEVKILTNSTTSVDEESAIVIFGTFRSIPQLMQNGAEVRMWTKSSTMHRKGGIVDGRFAFFGSDNLDRRGDHWESEDIVWVDDPQVVGEVHEQMLRDFSESERVDEDYIRKTVPQISDWKKVLSSVAMRYL